MTLNGLVRPLVMLRVLVAGSGIAVNESLTALLSEFEGLSVFGCAQEPAKILALIALLQPEVVVLDLELGGSVGLEVLRQIKRRPLPPRLIVLSHYDLAPLREAALAAGADHFLVKATECGRLQEILHAWLGQSKAGALALAEATEASNPAGKPADA